jgi:hypothetical protein
VPSGFTCPKSVFVLSWGVVLETRQLDNQKLGGPLVVLVWGSTGSRCSVGNGTASHRLCKCSCHLLAKAFHVVYLMCPDTSIHIGCYE